YQLDQAAPETTISIRNSAGTIVFSEEKALFAGTSTYQWDGKATGGVSVPEGLYTITITAKNADGDAVKVTTSIDGVVDGVDMTGNEPLLLIGGQSINLSAVRAVKQS
ncbi:MAG: flagellar hook assembly protein FlgD, partial [Alphaproteobacteria bacterium]